MTMRLPAPAFRHRSAIRLLLILCAHAGLAGAATDFPAGPRQRLTLQCEVFYTPARQIWSRAVDVEHDGHRMLALHIDGLKPYAFSMRGRQISTALDNERIRVDLAGGRWRSDFRGLASGEGSCSSRP